MENYFKGSFLFLAVALALSGCGGGGGSESNQKVEQPPTSSVTTPNVSPTVSAGEASSIREGETYTFSPTVSDSDSSNLTYSWSQISGPAVNIKDDKLLSASFTASDIDKVEVLKFSLTVVDGDGAEVSDTVSITIIPYSFSITLPSAIGSGCEFETNINVVNDYSFTSGSWAIRNASKELIDEGELLSGDKIKATIPTSGQFTLSTTIKFQNGTAAELEDSLVVLKSLPKDIKGVDYVVPKNESYVVCHDTNIWKDATLTILDGASLTSISNSKESDSYLSTILMWGGVNLNGTKDNRISIKNVVFKNDFVSTDTTVNVNAQYVDFKGNGTINNEDGITNIRYSTFESRYYQEDKGSLLYNTFKKGITLKPDGTLISHNDIYCEQLESCIHIQSYMFGDGYLNRKPKIAYNNIFDAKSDSITYDNDSFTNSDIDMRNNYWGGVDANQLDSIFLDSNDVPDLSYTFIYDPFYEQQVIHDNEQPSAVTEDKITATTYYDGNGGPGVFKSLTLDASASFDPDGDELSYEWIVLSAPENANYSLENNLTAFPSFKSFVTGTYEAMLTVSDGYLTDSSIITIEVVEPFSIEFFPVTPNAQIDICGVDGTADYSGYIWSFSNCQISGVAGNKVKITVTNNSSVNNFYISEVGITIDDIDQRELAEKDGVISESGDYPIFTIEPLTSIDFIILMERSGVISNGFVATPLPQGSGSKIKGTQGEYSAVSED